MATYTNKNGTNSDDTLTYTAKGTYHANGGNDTIKITGGSGIVVYTDKGNNTINVTGGSMHTVKVAATNADSNKQSGVEKLTIERANIVDAYLGSGKDEVILTNTDGKKTTGALSQIHGGDWGDTFTVNTGARNYQLYGDAGDDTFTVEAGSNLVLWGGAANDTFNVNGGTGIKLRGGDSADVYNIRAAGVDMQLGYGNDVVTVSKGDKQTIKANLGVNTINLNAGTGHVITSDIDQVASKKAGKDVGYGVDIVNIGGNVTNVTANLGDGKDVVKITDGSGHKIYTEGWGDTITIGGSYSPSQNNYVNAGDGDDTIECTGIINSKLYGGNGADSLIFNMNWYYDQYTTGNYISGGAGNDYIAGFVGMNIVAGDGGDDKIHLQYSGSGSNKCIYNYVRGGDGNDTITVESASNIISGGNGIDTVSLVGGCKNKVYGGSNTDTINCDASSKQNYLSGGDGADVFEIAGAENTVMGGAGDDRVILVAGSSKNLVVAGAGNDFIGIGCGKTSTGKNVAFLNFVTGRGSTDKDVVNMANLSLGNFTYVYDTNNDIVKMTYNSTGWTSDTDTYLIRGVSKLTTIAFGSSNASKLGDFTYSGTSFLNAIKTGGKGYSTGALDSYIASFGESESVAESTIIGYVENIQAGVKDEILKLTSND